MTTTAHLPVAAAPPVRRVAEGAIVPTGDFWRPAVATVTDSKRTAPALAPYVWALTRLSLASVFLWAFFDKMFGLGHETVTAHAWVNGGSPSLGFLGGATGPFAGFYQNIAGAAWVDWTFMIGLVAIGLALLLGIGMRIAAISGAVMVMLMWSASLPPQDHIFMDNHIVYALVLLGIAIAGAGNTLGLGRWWTATPVVRRFPWLTWAERPVAGKRLLGSPQEPLRHADCPQADRRGIGPLPRCPCRPQPGPLGA